MTHKITLDLKADGSGAVTLDGKLLEGLRGLDVQHTHGGETIVALTLAADVGGTAEAEIEDDGESGPAEADHWIRIPSMSGVRWRNNRTGELRDTPPPETLE